MFRLKYEKMLIVIKNINNYGIILLFFSYTMILFSVKNKKILIN